MKSEEAEKAVKKALSAEKAKVKRLEAELVKVRAELVEAQAALTELSETYARAWNRISELEWHPAPAPTERPAWSPLDELPDVFARLLDSPAPTALLSAWSTYTQTRRSAAAVAALRQLHRWLAELSKQNRGAP